MTIRPHSGASEARAERAAAAAYVAELSAGLAMIARRHGLDTLCYLLDMAQLEAENAARLGNGRH